MTKLTVVEQKGIDILFNLDRLAAGYGREVSWRKVRKIASIADRYDRSLDSYTAAQFPSEPLKRKAAATEPVNTTWFRARVLELLLKFSRHQETGNGVYLTPMMHPVHVNNTAKHDTDHDARTTQNGARLVAPAWKKERCGE